jgi:hypothetical protein
LAARVIEAARCWWQFGGSSSSFAAGEHPARRAWFFDVVKVDPGDHRVLECSSVWSVTGDKAHLLPLKQFRGINPREFVEQS